MPESTASIVYDEALRGIARQQAVIDGLRTRTGTLFAAASLVTAFLGGQAATENRDLGLLIWVAIGAFVALFLLVLAILWPWRFRFVLDPKILIEDHLQKDVPELETYLGEIWGENYELNQVRMDQLHWLFRGACVALSLEVVSLLISLGRG